MRLTGWVVIATLLVGTARTALADKVVLVAGGQETVESGAATQVKLDGPFGVDFGPGGALFLVEMLGQRVRAIDPGGQLTTLAGTGEKGSAGDDGPARQASFNGMHSLVVGKDGGIYLADTWNQRVRKIDPTSGNIAAFAGTGEKGFSGDGGAALAARFGGIYCLAMQPGGERMFLADLDNRRIRAIDMRTGTVETVAGNGKRGVPRDGAMAVDSPLVDPRAVAVDDRGQVYILERGGDALRVVDTSGRIRTLLGAGALACRDENDTTPLPLKGPKHLCVDPQGNVLIADTENHLIRKYLPGEHKLVRLAGTGKPGASGLGGPPLEAALNQPHGVHVDPSGQIYIADSTNGRILKIEP